MPRLDRWVVTSSGENSLHSTIQEFAGSDGNLFPPAKIIFPPQKISKNVTTYRHFIIIYVSSSSISIFITFKEICLAWPSPFPGSITQTPFPWSISLINFQSFLSSSLPSSTTSSQFLTRSIYHLCPGAAPLISAQVLVSCESGFWTIEKWKVKKKCHSLFSRSASEKK